MRALNIFGGVSSGALPVSRIPPLLVRALAVPVPGARLSRIALMLKVG